MLTIIRCAHIVSMVIEHLVGHGWHVADKEYFLTTSVTKMFDHNNF